MTQIGIKTPLCRRILPTKLYTSSIYLLRWKDTQFHWPNFLKYYCTANHRSPKFGKEKMSSTLSLVTGFQILHSGPITGQDSSAPWNRFRSISWFLFPCSSLQIFDVAWCCVGYYNMIYSARTRRHFQSCKLLFALTVLDGQTRHVSLLYNHNKTLITAFK